MITTTKETNGTLRLELTPAEIGLLKVLIYSESIESIRTRQFSIFKEELIKALDEGILNLRKQELNNEDSNNR